MFSTIFFIVFRFIFIYNFIDWLYKYSVFSSAFCKAELELVNRLRAIYDSTELTEEDIMMIYKTLRRTVVFPPMFAYKHTTPEKLFYDTFGDCLECLNKFEKLHEHSEKI